MQNPKIILENLKKYSTQTNYKYKKIYKFFYNPDFFKIAYSNIYSKSSNITIACDGSTIDGMSEDRINNLIQSLRDGTYTPTNLRKNGNTQSILIPSFNDKMVQEIIRMILETIYEDNFSDYSHGFRPNKSCHTALNKIRQQFQATTWFINGNIQDYFNNINHEFLLKIIQERIFDHKFIHLINLFLKSGYLENNIYNKTYSGIPQGSIIGPILSNIYLNKFDKYIEMLKSSFDCGNRRKTSKEYAKLSYKCVSTRKKLRNNKSSIEELKKYEKKLKKFRGSSQDMMDPNYKRLRYIRYADVFLIGVIGSKKDANEISLKIKNWLKNELALDTSPTKYKITHNSEKVRFLGYDIVSVRNCQKKYENGNIKLSVPHDVMVNFIIKNRFGKWWCNPKSKKDELKAIHRAELTHIDDYEILKQYDLILRGIYNYYKLAENVYKIGNFAYIVKLSYLKTLGCKYKCQISRFYRNQNYYRESVAGCTYNGTFYPLFNGPFKKIDQFKNSYTDDKLPILNKYFGRNSILKRMEANMCELCGNTSGPFEIHHIHKLKDLKNKKRWEILMSERNRKTLVLCKNCHIKLHAGKL